MTFLYTKFSFKLLPCLYSNKLHFLGINIDLLILFNTSLYQVIMKKFPHTFYHQRVVPVSATDGRVVSRNPGVIVKNCIFYSSLIQFYMKLLFLIFMVQNFSHSTCFDIFSLFTIFTFVNALAHWNLSLKDQQIQFLRSVKAKNKAAKYRNFLNYSWNIQSR